jgi:hypothetical protein
MLVCFAVFMVFTAFSAHPILIALQRPLAGDLALPRPETVAVPAGDVSMTEAGIVPATEAKRLAWHRYADIHPAHTGFDAIHHSARKVTA